MGDSLGDRMKDYEAVTRLSLVKKSPAIIRVDGKAFHTLTRGMERPFDFAFTRCMWDTAEALCKEVQGCQLALVQSDELSLLLIDYQAITSQGWFTYGVQKMASVSASVATAAFGRAFRERFPASKRDGVFDSRVFNLPRDEVVNYFIWRQQDATRNSIQMLGQAHFSQKQLHGLNCDRIQEKLFQEKGINWNDQPTHFKRGVAFVKQGVAEAVEGVQRLRWVIDHETPVFTRDRDYINRLVEPTSTPESGSGTGGGT